MGFYDRSRVWIDGTLVDNQQSFKPSDESGREGFTPNGETRPVGSTVKPGAEMLEIELKPNTTSKIDFYALKKSGKVVKVVAQYYAGSTKAEKWQWTAQVAEFNKPESDNEGKVTQTVKFLVIGEGRRL
jgi:hypothetical protein